MINGINEICAILDIGRLFYSHIWSGIKVFAPQKLDGSFLRQMTQYILRSSILMKIEDNISS